MCVVCTPGMLVLDKESCILRTSRSLRGPILLVIVRPRITRILIQLLKIEQKLRSRTADSEQRLALHTANNIANLLVSAANERSVLAIYLGWCILQLVLVDYN